MSDKNDVSNVPVETPAETTDTLDTLDSSKLKVPIRGYIFLAVGIVIFSGLLNGIENPLKFLDFSTLAGSFGTIVEGADPGFRGVGGVGAREGAVFALTALPSVALAVGLISVIEGQGGLKAAQKILTPLMRPILGVPGWGGLALIGSLQSTDTGAALTYQVVERNLITERELGHFAGFLFPACAPIGQYFAFVVMLFPFWQQNGINPIIPLVVILIGKVFTCNLMRLYLSFVERRLAKNEKNEG